MCGKGPCKSLIYSVPIDVVGNTLIISPPYSYASKISVGDNAPGMLTAPYFLVICIVSLFSVGDKINVAPLNIASLADSASNTVPAPTTTLSFISVATSSIDSKALGEFIVISIARIPDLYKLLTIGKISSGFAFLMIAIILVSFIVFKVSILTAPYLITSSILFRFLYLSCYFLLGNPTTSLFTLD